MPTQRLETGGPFDRANEWISWISGYESEYDVEAASRQIVEYFGFESYVFGALSRASTREQYRYLVGCSPRWFYVFIL